MTQLRTDRSRSRVSGACLWAVAVAVGAAACEDGGSRNEMPRIASSSRVAADDPRIGEIWPILLQHCLRDRACDPTRNFGVGAGEASGVVGDALWFAQTPARAPEGGETYGARIQVGFVSAKGQGGAAGRPLTLSETPGNLRATTDRRSWLVIEHRAPGGVPEPYAMSVLTAQLAIRMPEGSPKDPKANLEALTEALVAAWTWPDGRQGAKIELKTGAKTGSGQTLWSSTSAGLPAQSGMKPEDAAALGSEPWKFYGAHNLRDESESARPVMEALNRGESLLLVVSAPNGLLLQDAIPTSGYKAALAEATAALADPAIELPLTERCRTFLDAPPADWSEVSPASKACDARTPEQRLTR